MLWKRFKNDESGAVTVDWVVLTAAVIGMGMIVLVPIAFSTDSTVSRLSDFIANIPLGSGNN